MIVNILLSILLGMIPETLFFTLFLTYTKNLSLKIVYKNNVEIIDVFIVNLGLIYIFVINFLCAIFINNNYLVYYNLLIINKVLLFLPFIFKNKFNLLYKKYCSLWNRNYQKKQPIKSITIRNISLIIMNIFVFIMNIILVSISNLAK